MVSRARAASRSPRLQGGELVLQHGGELLPRLVDHLSRGGTLLGGQLAMERSSARQLALFAQHLDAQRVQGGNAVHLLQLAGDHLADLRQPFLHAHCCIHPFF